MIIDCHTHFGAYWHQQHSDPKAWVAILDRHGVDKAFLMCCDGLFDSSQCGLDNNRIAEAAALMPERLIPIGSSWPQLGAKGIKEAERCLQKLGMRALKFHPWVQGFSTADPVFGEICTLAGECGVPVIFHDGTPCYSLPEQIGGLARRFPRTTFVLGHAGILWSWRSALAAAKHKNVWICLCGPHLRAMEILCKQVNSNRIIWGSDFGFGTSDPIGYRLGLINKADIDDRLRQAILGENPLRLINSNPDKRKQN